MTVVLAIIGCVFLIAILCAVIPAILVVLVYMIEFAIAGLAVWALIKLISYLVSLI